MALDADTIDCLDDVKKGKPRRFVMICKGVQIKSLVVYKKGSVERYKKQAKEEGKGQFYHGVIDGKGVDIAFKLCRADGYEKPPGKELILKDFLNTEADMKFKPVYEIVDVLPEVGERDESEGSQVESEQEATPPEAPPMPEAGTYTADDLAAECKRLKAALYPPAKEAIAAHPGQKDAVIRLLGLADKHVKATQFATAIENYQELSALLASLPTAEKATGDPAVLFNERLKTLLPEVKAAAGTPQGDEAKLKVSEAGVLARKKDFDQANTLLDQAEAALQKSAASQAASTNGDPAVLFNERLKALLPEVKAAAGTPAGDEAKLKVSEAGVTARKKDFIQANILLDQAEAALKNVTLAQTGESTAKKVGDKVAYAKLRLAWDSATKQVHADLQKLENAILDAFKTDPEFGQIQSKARKLDSILARFEEDLGDILDDALNATDDAARSRHHQKAASVVQNYRKYVDDDPFIGAVETNPFAPVSVRKNLSKTLGLLAKQLEV